MVLEPVSQNRVRTAGRGEVLGMALLTSLERIVWKVQFTPAL